MSEQSTPQPRRRTTKIAAASLIGILAVGGATFALTRGDAPAPETAKDPVPTETVSTPADTPPATPVETPRKITCEGELVSAVFDFAFPLPDGKPALEAAQEYADSERVVLVGKRRALALREDGTAHLQINLIGSEKSGYVVGGYEACSGEGPPD